MSSTTRPVLIPPQPPGPGRWTPAPAEVSAEPEGPAIGGDFVPLSRRVLALMLLRLGATGVMAAVGLLGGLLHREQLLCAGAYLAVTAVLSLLVLLPRRVGLAGLGTALSLDCVAAQAAHQYLGPTLATDFVLAAFLAMVCLLASFRTGIRMALWQTVLAVFAMQGVESGLLPEPPGYRVADPTLSLGAWLTLMWLTVIVVSASAAVGERELRRRRYDSESMRTFATALHRDEEPTLVLARALAFATREMDGRRAMVCRAGADGAAIVQRHDERPGTPGPPPGRSELLEGPRDRPVLQLRFDPAREPWLAAALPGARRVVLVPLDAGEDPMWLVFEHRGQRGSRVEQRLIAMCAQLGATTSLALSRAVLLQRVRAAATMDGLTGVANRRSFDDLLGRLSAQYRAEGTPCGLVVVDADHFKSVNDTHGHQVGDQVLQGVAGALVAAAGTSGVVHRYGGEEFTVLVPGQGAAGTAALAERMRLGLHAYGGPVPITASFGVADLTPTAPGGAELVAAADRALYEAKEAGRDRVVVARPSAPLPAN